MNYFISAWQNGFNFEGRARRAEYWMFVLFSLIVIYGLTGLSLAVNNAIPAMIATLYSFAALIPNIAVAIRRMHDNDKSGWYCLIPFYNLILTVSEGTKGENQYGPDPKENA